MPFGFGHWWIILLVLLIVLIVYGPGKLPDVGGAIGRGIREFRKASSDLQDEIKKSASPTESGQEPRSSATDVKPTTDTKA